jgi:hypothetical protein
MEHKSHSLTSYRAFGSKKTVKKQAHVHPYIRPSTAVSLRPFMSVFKSATVRYGYPYNITV